MPIRSAGDSEAARVAARIAGRRMRNLGLVGPPAAGYLELVGALGAVQAQDYGPALWSIAQRTAPTTESALEQSFSQGRLIRTHVLRPTWHFVRPQDLRRLLRLTAPRVHALNGTYYRKFDLDAAAHRRCAGVLARELAGGNHLTRTEIGVLLAGAGLNSTAMHLNLLLMHAELEGLICSGARRGKQQTYALLEERVAPAPELDRESELIELARRYFTGHGPATVKDFRWWCSLPTPDILGAIESLGDELVREILDGTTYWSAVDAPDRTGPGRKEQSPRVFLLQGYDEYLVGYSESKYVLDISGAARSRPEGRKIFTKVILLDTQVAGHWRSSPASATVRIEAVLDAPFDPAQHRALRRAADEYAEFLGLTAELTTSSG